MNCLYCGKYLGYDEGEPFCSNTCWSNYCEQIEVKE
jgi:hypothetical protein